MHRVIRFLSLPAVLVAVATAGPALAQSTPPTSTAEQLAALEARMQQLETQAQQLRQQAADAMAAAQAARDALEQIKAQQPAAAVAPVPTEIGRASSRERVGQYV